MGVVFGLAFSSPGTAQDSSGRSDPVRPGVYGSCGEIWGRWETIEIEAGRFSREVETDTRFGGRQSGDYEVVGRGLFLVVEETIGSPPPRGESDDVPFPPTPRLTIDTINSVPVLWTDEEGRREFEMNGTLDPSRVLVWTGEDEDGGNADRHPHCRELLEVPRR